MNDTIIQPFTNIEAAPIVIGGQVADQSGSSSDTIQIGAGATCFKADSSGIWLGGNTFAAATFSVDMAGHVTAFDMTVVGGVVKYGKTSFTDTTHDGYYFGPEGLYYGSASDITRLKYTLSSGVIDFIGSHSGGSIGGQSIANIVNVATDTADIVPLSLSVNSTGVSIAGDGTLTAYVVLTWTAIVSNTFDHYLIRYKKHSYTYYTYLEVRTNTMTIEGLVPNTSYDFGIASVNRYGTISSFSSNVTSTTAADSVVPGNVIGLTATAGIQYSILEWTHNTDLDLASYNIYRNTTNSSATATLVGNTFADKFVDGGLTGGQPYFYWLKAIDTSGNISANFSTGATATPRNVGTTDVEVIAATKILIDGTVYLSNWRNATDITKIDGGKIYTGSVTTTQLNFTPVQNTNVIASINASAEGITIAAANITIGGATTFAAGYDPSTKIKTFVQASQPTAENTGDLWYDSDDGHKLYRWNGTAWANIQDASIGIAISAAAAAQGTADGKVTTFYQSATPTAEGVGDLWVKTDSGNKLYRWSGSAWLEVQDAAIAQAIADAGTAQDTADGKIVTFYQATQPTAEGVGDVWFDTGNGNQMYRWNGTAWSAVPDANKLDLLGGSYDSAASGARVRIFPDANTGLQIIDDASNDVFKAIIGGTDVGDIIFGNWAGNQGFKYDKSAGAAGEITFKGNISGVNGTFGTISAGVLDGCDIYANNLRFKKNTYFLDCGSLDGWNVVLDGGIITPHAQNLINISASTGADRTPYLECGYFGVQIGEATTYPSVWSKYPSLEFVARYDNDTGQTKAGFAKVRIGGASTDAVSNCCVEFKLDYNATDGYHVHARYAYGTGSYVSALLTSGGSTIRSNFWHRYRMEVLPNGSNYNLCFYIDDELVYEADNVTFDSGGSKIVSMKVQNNWTNNSTTYITNFQITSIIYQAVY